MKHCIFFAVCATHLFAAGVCSRAKEAFLGPGAALVVNVNGDYLSYKARKDELTRAARNIVDRAIIDLLSNHPANPDVVRSCITEIQSAVPQYAEFASESTNVPLVVSIGSQELLVAYQVFRGGVGIPENIAVFDLFQRDPFTLNWRLNSSIDGFETFEEFGYPRSNGDLLIVGKRLGSTGTPFRFALIRANKKGILTEIRNLADMPRVSVTRIEENSIFLEAEQAGDRPHHPVMMRQEIKITPSGFERLAPVYEAIHSPD